jgi:hypothetical protein
MTEMMKRICTTYMMTAWSLPQLGWTTVDVGSVTGPTGPGVSTGGDAARKASMEINGIQTPGRVA